MSTGGLEKTLFQLKFTARTLNRQAKKARKDEATEIERMKKALVQGNTDGARIYAANAIRKKTESLNLLRLASRVDAVSSRVQTAVTMRQVTGNIAQVVQGLGKVTQDMNLEMISKAMDKFEEQVQDMDVQASYMEAAISSTTATETPQDEVETLLQRTADEANIELAHGLDRDGEAPVEVPKDKIGEEDTKLAERLRALRPA